MIVYGFQYFTKILPDLLHWTTLCNSPSDRSTHVCAIGWHSRTELDSNQIDSYRNELKCVELDGCWIVLGIKAQILSHLHFNFTSNEPTTKAISMHKVTSSLRPQRLQCGWAAKLLQKSTLKNAKGENRHFCVQLAHFYAAHTATHISIKIITFKLDDKSSFKIIKRRNDRWKHNVTTSRELAASDNQCTSNTLISTSRQCSAPQPQRRIFHVKRVLNIPFLAVRSFIRNCCIEIENCAVNDLKI